MSNQGVCIVQEQAINQSGLVDRDCLVKAGYSVRVSGNCLPDLIISRAGTTAAYLLVNSQVVLGGSEVWNRAEKLRKTFKHSFLLANASCCKDTAEAACRFLGKLSIICYPHSSSLCQRAMDLFHSLATPQNELKSQDIGCFPTNLRLSCTCVQRLQAVMSSTAIDQVLTSMPGMRLNGHHANALRMLGSLQTLANSSAEAIVECTDLDYAQAVKLVEAFNVPMS